MITVITAGVAALPLAQAKAHLNVEHDLHDGQISALAAAAQAHVEQVCDIALTAQTIQLTLDGFPSGGSRLRLPRPPLLEVLTVTYIDRDGQSTALPLGGLAVAKSDRAPACLSPLSGAWPATALRPDAVTIEYRAGAAVVDAPLLQAQKLLVGQWYANKEAVVVGAPAAELPLGVAALLTPYRVWSL